MAAPSVRAVGTQTAGTGAGSLSGSMPTHAADDILLLVIETGAEAIANVSAGWAEVTNSPQVVAVGADSRLTVYWKRATSASETAPTFDDPGDHWLARVISIQGCRTSGNPWDATAGGTKTSASTSSSIAGVTTLTNDCLILYIAATGTDTGSDQYSGWANASLTGVGEVTDGWTTNGNGGGFAIGSGVLATAGATGTMTATIATSSTEAFLCIALASLASGTSINVTPDPVVVTLSAVAPAISATVVITPDAVALTTAPVAPLVGTSLDVGPDPVAVTLTPVAPAVGQAQDVTPDPIAIALTPVAPATASTADMALTPVQLALTPVAPAIAVSIAVAPDPVVLQLIIVAPDAGEPIELAGEMTSRGDLVARLTFVGAGMPVEVEVYDSSFSPPRLIHVLEGARDASWQDILNDLGSGTFRIPRVDPKAGDRVIAKGNLVKMRLHGAARFPWKIEQVGRVYAATDGLAGEWLTVSGRGAEVLMEGARVASPDRSEPGYIAVILSDLIAEAATSTRPILSALTVDWTSTQDTGGDAWEDRATWAIPWGSTTVLDVWRQAIAMGIEFRLLADLTLEAYESGLGTDRSSSIIFRPGRHIRESIAFEENESQWLNVVYVKGSAGSTKTVYGSHGDPRRGTREGFVDFGATNEAAALERVGQSAIAASEAMAKAFRLPVLHGTGQGEWEPYLDYRKGDTVGLAVPGLPTSVRVVGLTIAATEGNDYLVDLDVNAIRLDNMVRLKKLVESNANQLIRVAGL